MGNSKLSKIINARKSPNEYTKLTDGNLKQHHDGIQSFCESKLRNKVKLHVSKSPVCKQTSEKYSKEQVIEIVKNEMSSFKSAYQITIDEIMNVLKGQSKEIEVLRRKIS